jgi:hypothetical protein
MKKVVWLFGLAMVAVIVAVVLRVRAPQPPVTGDIETARPVELRDHTTPHQADTASRPPDADVSDEEGARVTGTQRPPVPRAGMAQPPADEALIARPTSADVPVPVDVMIEPSPMTVFDDDTPPVRASSSGGGMIRPAPVETARAGSVDAPAWAAAGEIDEFELSTDPLDALTADEELMHDPPPVAVTPPPPMPAIPPGAVHIGRGSPGWSHQALQHPPYYPEPRPERVAR